MGKVVQTELDEENYRILKEMLARRKLTLREGIKLAISKFLESEVKMDPDDPFLTHEPTGRSGLKDLSTRHDQYLYSIKKGKS